MVVTFPFFRLKSGLGSISFVHFTGRDDGVANIREMSGKGRFRLGGSVSTYCNNYSGGLVGSDLSMCHQRPKVFSQTYTSSSCFHWLLSLSYAAILLISSRGVWLEWKYSQVAVKRATERAWWSKRRWFKLSVHLNDQKTFFTSRFFFSCREFWFILSRFLRFLSPP